ncbi:MAG: nucleoside 2-deoxyribosyltransferase [Candidatus Bathyarchaeota archaeon]|nr:nucleoside 2-deoxyribosyltransferase [Candidatus Bathyarchaeota archaeon]
MKKKVFISGPIHGMENKQEYRQHITEVCNRLGFDVIDPWLREKVIYRKKEPCWWNNVPVADFVQRDLEDAERCDIMVVYMPKISAGACMELFYAKLKGKKIIVVSDMECLSPWITYHSDIIVKDFNALEAALKQVS